MAAKVWSVSGRLPPTVRSVPLNDTPRLAPSAKIDSGSRIHRPAMLDCVFVGRESEKTRPPGRGRVACQSPWLGGGHSGSLSSCPGRRSSCRPAYRHRLLCQQPQPLYRPGFDRAGKRVERTRSNRLNGSRPALDAGRHIGKRAIVTIPAAIPSQVSPEFQVPISALRYA
ncbi:MAG: hypothetical protein Ct9H300mP16_14320 [Pseudomonadota bacterium]|nr:MAG: hypothetical protein Ct9H300mP16_14320 [Pseudomonadota bacterium]